MKKLFSTLFITPFLILLLTIKTAAISPEARFSLLTASPGTELYSVFGHSALRVYDPENLTDEVYNYGTFDFETPGFYLKFSRGQLLYQLSVTSMSVFLFEYESERRAVYEQVLNLTAEEKYTLYDFLQVNRLPENKSYLYDFFYDNCSTRIRDIVDRFLDIDWGEDRYSDSPRSFRDMLQPYLAGAPWPRFGIDIALGLPADRIAGPWHYMFLPDELMFSFDQARHRDGRPLAGEVSVVLQETPPGASKTLLRPLLLMWLVFAAGLLSLLNPRFSLWFDRIFFAALGVTGLVIFLLWFFSDHTSTNQNMNLMWALPTHLYFIFRLNKLHQPKIVRWYFRGVLVIASLLMILWPLIPQGFNPSFFPLLAIIAVKSYFITFFRESGTEGRGD